MRQSVDGEPLPTDRGCLKVDRHFLGPLLDGVRLRGPSASLTVTAEDGDMRCSAILMTFSVFLASRVCADWGLCAKQTQL